MGQQRVKLWVGIGACVLASGTGVPTAGAETETDREARTLHASEALLVAASSGGEGGEAERAEAAAILKAELPIIPIAWYQQTLAVSDRVTGAIIDPFERTFGLQDMQWAE